MDLTWNAKGLNPCTQGGFWHQNFSHLAEWAAAGGHHPHLGSHLGAQDQRLHLASAPATASKLPLAGTAMPCQEGKTQIPLSHNIYFAKQNYLFYLAAKLREE